MTWKNPCTTINEPVNRWTNESTFARLVSSPKGAIHSVKSRVPFHCEWWWHADDLRLPSRNNIRNRNSEVFEALHFLEKISCSFFFGHKRLYLTQSEMIYGGYAGFFNGLILGRIDRKPWLSPANIGNSCRLSLQHPSANSGNSRSSHVNYSFLMSFLSHSKISCQPMSLLASVNYPDPWSSWIHHGVLMKNVDRLYHRQLMLTI